MLAALQANSRLVARPPSTLTYIPRGFAMCPADLTMRPRLAAGHPSGLAGGPAAFREAYVNADDPSATSRGGYVRSDAWTADGRRAGDQCGWVVVSRSNADTSCWLASAPEVAANVPNMILHRFHGYAVWHENGGRSVSPLSQRQYMKHLERRW